MLLQVKDLSISFGGVKAVSDVSFDVSAGEVFTIIGPNGAGKTTIFNMISRLYRQTGGAILFDGRPIDRASPQQVARAGVARTFQNIELFDHASVMENILVGCHVRRRTGLWQDMMFLPSVARQEAAFRRRVEEVIEFLELEGHRNAPISELAYGTRKLVEIGRALAMTPRLLLLDEPSSGLNPEETSDMAHWIRDMRTELGITVLMVEHDMGLVRRVSDRVLALDAGRVTAVGSHEDVASNPDVIRAYLGD